MVGSETASMNGTDDVQLLLLLLVVVIEHAIMTLTYNIRRRCQRRMITVTKK